MQPHSYSNTKDLRLPTNKNSISNIELQQSRSISKFYIKYEESSGVCAQKPKQSKRYSIKYQSSDNSKNVQVKPKKKKSSENLKGIPSYLRPTQSSAQMERLRAASNQQLDPRQKSSILTKMRSKSLQREQLEPEKEFNRVPIEYYDERDGKGPQVFRGRIIYRGYQPKNTYFFLKALKPLMHFKPTIHTNMPITQNIRNQHELKFDSKFESGNLSAAIKINSQQYWLFMREDTNTHGLRQWYYFQVTVRKVIKAKFRLYKFSKYYSLYRHGMKPYTRTSNSQNNYCLTQWQQNGKHIKYQYDPQLKCFYLEFQYQFIEQNQKVEFAMLPPYTYSMMKQFLWGLVKGEEDNEKLNQESTKKQEEQKKIEEKQGYPKIATKNDIQVKVDLAGNSLAGLDIPVIQITYSKADQQTKIDKKLAILVLTRTHPGQTVSNFALENFIDRLFQLPDLIKRFDFYIIPMVNPDGVFIGNHRTSAIGQDLNRNFNNRDLQTFPEIQAIHNLVFRIRKQNRIHYILDLHGHSARRNIFAYGDEHEIGSKAYLHSRIIPKLLSEAISSFKYNYCIFKESKQKKNTARVYYTKRFNYNCITFQQSYGLLDHGRIGIHNWRNFGTALADSLQQYAQLYFQDHRESVLASYLSDQITKQTIAQQEKIFKHKKILGLIDAKEAQVKQEKQKKINDGQKQGEESANQNNLSFEIDLEDIRLQGQEENDGQEEGSQNVGDQNMEEGVDKQSQEESVKQSELSSGDEDLQLDNEELEVIKKQIVKVGCMKEALKRQKYNIADARLELFDNSPSIHHRQQQSSANFISNGYYSNKLIQQKSAAIPRIVKLQNRKKQQYNSIIRRFDQEKQKELLSLLERQKMRDERRVSIEQKFYRKLELPSISSANNKR